MQIEWIEFKYCLNVNSLMGIYLHKREVSTVVQLNSIYYQYSNPFHVKN